MKVKRVEGNFARVGIGRLIRRVNIQMLPQVKAGDYVIVHAGFAIEKVDAKGAEETLRLLHEIH